MTEPAGECIGIARSDLQLAAIVISVRLDDAMAEQQRLMLIDELLRMERDLGSALGAHARHALSESRGSRSTWDVMADSEQVYGALARDALTLQRLARDYRALASSVDPKRSEIPPDGVHDRLGP